MINITWIVALQYLSKEFPVSLLRKLLAQLFSCQYLSFVVKNNDPRKRHLESKVALKQMRSMYLWNIEFNLLFYKYFESWST